MPLLCFRRACSAPCGAYDACMQLLARLCVPAACYVPAPSNMTGCPADIAAVDASSTEYVPIHPCMHAWCRAGRGPRMQRCGRALWLSTPCCCQWGATWQARLKNCVHVCGLNAHDIAIEAVRDDLSVAATAFCRYACLNAPLCPLVCCSTGSGHRPAALVDGAQPAAACVHACK